MPTVKNTKRAGAKVAGATKPLPQRGEMAGICILCHQSQFTELTGGMCDPCFRRIGPKPDAPITMTIRIDHGTACQTLRALAAWKGKTMEEIAVNDLTASLRLTGIDLCDAMDAEPYEPAR